MVHFKYLLLVVPGNKEISGNGYTLRLPSTKEVNGYIQLLNVKKLDPFLNFRPSNNAIKFRCTDL